MPGFLSQLGRAAGLFALGAAGGQTYLQAMERNRQFELQQHQADLQQQQFDLNKQVSLSQLRANDFAFQQAQDKAAQAEQMRLADMGLAQNLWPDVGPPAPADIANQSLAQMAVQRGDYKTALSAMEPPTLKAPTTRTRIAGDKSIVEQFNPASGGWDFVSEGPRLGRTAEDPSFAGKPLPRDAQENLLGGLDALRALDKMAAGLGETGLVRGQLSRAEAYLGQNPKAIEFQTGRNNMKLAAQALIKGIPSNFDVQTVINTLPEIGLAQEVNQSRERYSRRVTQELIRGTISFYKGTGHSIPPYVVQQAKNLGVRVDDVAPWDGASDPLQGAIDVKQPQQGDRGRIMQEARDAIDAGADPEKVKARLREMGIE